MTATNGEPLKGKRILVLEDDFYLATDEKALLERAGATVVGPLGSSCLPGDIDAAGPLDGAVVDINLGRGSDFGFARLLHQRGTPFVFVTGYDAAVIPADLASIPRLEKPVRERDLISAVSQIVVEGP
jgi:FixJ family two-component response regulator